METRYSLVLAFVVPWLLFDTIAAMAQWHTVGREGPKHILSVVRAKSATGAHAGAPGATLLVRCAGELPGISFFEFGAVVKEDPYAIQAECEEENDFCTDLAIPLQMVVETPSEDIVRTDTASVRDLSYLYPRTESQRERWLDWLDRGSRLQVSFEWYENGEVEWEWALGGYGRARDRACK